MLYLGLLALVALAVGAYFLFRDTMNRIQYVEHLRLYWITKDNGSPSIPWCTYAFMRQTSEPYWYGDGVQFRFRKHTFQVGILKGKFTDEMEAMGAEDMDVDVPTLREWGRPDHEVKA